MTKTLLCLIASTLILSGCVDEREKLLKKSGVVIENTSSESGRCLIKIAYTESYDVDKAYVVDYNSSEESVCGLDRGSKVVVYIDEESKAVGLDF